MPKTNRADVPGDLLHVLNSPISETGKHNFLLQALKSWGLVDYQKIRHWSRAALAIRLQREAAGNPLQGRGPRSNGQLIRDHVVPSAVLVDLFMRHQWVNESQIKTALTDYCFCCVITVAENKLLEAKQPFGLRCRMPVYCDSLDNLDIWARYRVRSIPWVFI